MNAKFNVLICATIVATYWSVMAHAQVGSKDPGVSGAVYTMTNGTAENSILVYSRNSNGLLAFQSAVSTRGRGSGGILDPLQSQGSLYVRVSASLLSVRGRPNAMMNWADSSTLYRVENRTRIKEAGLVHQALFE